jgi:hypothetical protein
MAISTINEHDREDRRADQTPSPAPPKAVLLKNTMRMALLAVVGIVGLVVIYVLVTRGRETADLQVGQISAESPYYPATAIPYSLPQKVFVVDTATSISRCTETAQGEEIHGITTLAMTSKIRVDPSQQYYMYFESGTSKNLDYAVEVYDTGTLKTISASIKDQLAPIAASAAGALVQVAKIGPVFGAAGAGAAPPPSNCSELNAAIKSNPKDGRLTLQQEDLWIPESSELPLAHFTVEVALSKLAQEFHLSRPYWTTANAYVELKVIGSVPPESPDLKFDAPICAETDQACPKQKPPLVKGLVLRNAVVADSTAYVCDSSCDATAPSQLTRVPSRTETVPQFGTRFLIPVHSGFAQDAAVAVSMNADGLITSLRLQSTSALGASIANIANQASGVTSVVSSLETSTTAANKSLADCLAAQKQVVAAGGSPIGTCQ